MDIATTPHNQLTPAMSERLAILVEEVGEVQELIALILIDRVNGQNFNEELNANYMLMLSREIGDVTAALSLLQSNGDLGGAPEAPEEDTGEDALQKLGRFSQSLSLMLKAIGKILRHGYENSNPDIHGGPTNRQTLEITAEDFYVRVRKLLEETSLSLSQTEIQDTYIRKLDKLRRYTHHQVFGD